MVMDRIDIHGSDEYRNGVLNHLDAHMVRTGNMELWVIAIILILAVIAWMPRKRR